MRIEGWILMAGSWVIILTLFVYCMARTLTSREDEQE